MWTQWCALGGSSQASDGITAAQEGDYGSKKKKMDKLFFILLFSLLFFGFAFFFSSSLTHRHNSGVDTYTNRCCRHQLRSMSKPDSSCTQGPIALFDNSYHLCRSAPGLIRCVCVSSLYLYKRKKRKKEVTFMC